MIIVRDVLAIASLGLSLDVASAALAQVTPPATPPQDQRGDAADGAAARGVRIIAPEAPPANIVANGQQAVPATPPLPAPPTANAIAPAKQRPAEPVGTLPPPVATPAVLKGCDRPVAKPALRFADPARFDRALKSKLRRGRTVVVDLDAPYPVANEAPAPLGAWLNEIEKSGGMVTVSPYCQKGRGLGGFFAKLFGGGPAEPYKTARAYDAVLHVDAVDQIVTQVEFAPRKAVK
ncbi:hypothetical protein OVY48_21780 [Sphingobium sp. SA2]|uniref:hypothetical protein n=1 Tax=Sphingobium sp. SA2 TaxID=1524832 RepID=UPI0028C15C7A|nr:hypothetical protein [Sphingobium sp. SA2]MDT7536033.1 hypothetical protein [Sphingobium sp. SA2]